MRKNEKIHCYGKDDFVQFSSSVVDFRILLHIVTDITITAQIKLSCTENKLGAVNSMIGLLKTFSGLEDESKKKALEEIIVELRYKSEKYKNKGYLLINQANAIEIAIYILESGSKEWSKALSIKLQETCDTLRKMRRRLQKKLSSGTRTKNSKATPPQGLPFFEDMQRQSAEINREELPSSKEPLQDDVKIRDYHL